MFCLLLLKLHVFLLFIHVCDHHIKSLEFVDEIADVNRNFSSLCHSNKLIENIQHEKLKRLYFSSEKCELLEVGSKLSDGFIYVNNKSITNSECTKYLGDQFNSFSINSDLVDAGVKKTKGSTIELILLCVKKLSFHQTNLVLCFCYIGRCFFQD